LGGISAVSAFGSNSSTRNVATESGTPWAVYLNLILFFFLMRILLAIGGVLLIGAGLWSCGGGEASDKPQTSKARFGTFTDKKGAEQPRIDVPDRPLPKQPLIRDIKMGKGAGARKGDVIAVYYIRANYKTGESEYTRWPPEKPLRWKLFAGAAWERKIEGMKAGGRREMLIPSRLAFGEGAIDYVFDLVAIKSSR
jgi:peptidylprolyl isomerase